MSWASQAACTGKPNLFFGSGHESCEQKQRREAKAKAICASCPVLVDCRVEGMGEKWGVWGALNPEERGHYKRNVGRNPYRSVA